ncbi:MAG: site-specific integrase [Clostridia bacterium]
METVQPIRDKKQIEAMKRILKSNNLRDYALFVLGINSGLRISDVLRIRDSDVLDEKGRIKDRISIREKKTEKLKDFPLGDTTVKALTEYLGKRLPTGAPLFPSRKEGGSKGSGSISREQAYRILNNAARLVGIKDNIGTHTLRKTFGYFAYLEGIDITRIQKLFNHSAPSVTLDYIGITQDDLDKVYLNLNL